MNTKSRNQHNYHINSPLVQSLWGFLLFSPLCSLSKIYFSPQPPQSLLTLVLLRRKNGLIRNDCLLFRCHVSRPFSQLFPIIVILCSDLLICMVAALLPVQGQEIGPQREAKCAFNLNNPFNLSSIMWKQLGAPIPFQFEGNSFELTSFRTQ